MWYAEHTLETTSGPEAIWPRWEDPEGWPEWDEDLAWAGPAGPLQPGSRGRLKRKGCLPQRFRVEDCQEGRALTYVAWGLLTRMRWMNRLEPGGLGCRVTRRVEVSGPMAWWLRLILAPRLRRTLPESVRRLARISAAREAGNAPSESPG